MYFIKIPVISSLSVCVLCSKACPWCTAGKRYRLQHFRRLPNSFLNPKNEVLDTDLRFLDLEEPQRCGTDPRDSDAGGVPNRNPRFSSFVQQKDGISRALSNDICIFYIFQQLEIGKFSIRDPPPSGSSGTLKLPSFVVS